MLYEFLTANTPAIISRARAKVAARRIPLPTDAELTNGIPLLLKQLIDRLHLAALDADAIGDSATRDGRELLAMGFTISQVVHGYGDVCQVVTELADEMDAPITAEEFHIFNRCLDDAITHAVTEYQRRRDESSGDTGTERAAVLARELLKELSAAMLAFAILQRGTVAIGGSTGAVLGRSLRAMRDRIINTLASARLEAGLGDQRRVSVSELIDDAEVEATMGSCDGDPRLVVFPVARGVHVNADQQVLLAAIGNLIQNAFKLNRARGRVSLRTTVTTNRVLIEVEDECGGLPEGDAANLVGLFEPWIDARGGPGLGLAVSRKGIEAMGGTLGVRDLPGKGCVFSIDLPRMPAD
jgi:signal transduction histidine kinase